MLNFSFPKICCILVVHLTSTLVTTGWTIPDGARSEPPSSRVETDLSLLSWDWDYDSSPEVPSTALAGTPEIAELSQEYTSFEIADRIAKAPSDGLSKVGRWKEKLRQDLTAINVSVSTLMKQTHELKSSIPPRMNALESQAQEVGKLLEKRKHNFKKIVELQKVAVTNSLKTVEEQKSLNSIVSELFANQSVISGQLQKLAGELNSTTLLVKQIAQESSRNSTTVALLLDDVKSLKAELKEVRKEMGGTGRMNMSESGGKQVELRLRALEVATGLKMNKLEEAVKIVHTKMRKFEGAATSKINKLGDTVKKTDEKLESTKQEFEDKLGNVIIQQQASKIVVANLAQIAKRNRIKAEERFTKLTRDYEELRKDAKRSLDSLFVLIKELESRVTKGKQSSRRRYDGHHVGSEEYDTEEV